MYDANSTICSSVHSASLTLFSQEEVRTLSSCRISDTNVFLDPHASSSSLSATFTAARGGGPEAVSGGLHDARLGSLDGREICETCGCRSDCPGHLGHIDLALPVFQPIFLPSLVKVLKLSCLHCERLRVSPAAAALFVKAFELLQLGCFDAVDEASRCASSALRSGARGVSAAFSLPPSQRVAVLRIFEKIDQELQRRGGAHPNVSAASAPASPPRKDCGERHDAVEEPEPDESEDAHSAARRTKRDAAGAETDRAEDAKEQQRVANLLRESTDFEKEENRLLLETFGHDISGSAWQVSTWRKLRDLLWTRAAASALCANCGRSNAVTFHVAQQSTGVEMRWKWTGTPPFDKNSAFFSFVRNATKRPGREEESEGRKKDDGRDDAAALFDERCLTYGKSGRAIGKLHLHAFQLMPMLQNVFKNSVDRRLLHCLFPMSIRLSSSCFFISSLPVSANKFRPPLAGGAAFGREGGGMPLLHPRTATLLELLKINEKVQFALTIMRHPDPTGALENPECWGELFGYSVATQEAGPDEEEKPPKKKRTDGDDEGEKAKAKGKVAESKSAAASVLSPEEQQKLKEFVLVHAAGNAAWLTSYAVQLQQKVNEIVDKTKAEKPLTAPAGIRQWMERKAGTIRQKLMGKRVNYAARTVLAPDALIATNEVGVPLDFAMKLSIPEKVTPRNVHVLSEMVINGPHKHPGALAIMDDAGNLFNLEFLSPATRRAKAHQLLLSASSSSSSLSPSSSDMPTTNGSFTVYRHVLDGDAVLMNRQPSLHRVSLMGHFVKITRGVSSVYHINDYLIRNNLLHLLVERKSAQSKLKALKNASGSDKREVGDEDEASRKKARKTEKKSLIHFSGLFKKKKTEKPSEEEEERKHDHDEERGLTKENVFRLNFVNCSSYNADFDGDEMNMHLPQDHVARTEAAYILNADCHFLVPKSGEPLRGLIQDLCLAGCLLTARDTFLDIHSFQTLVYSGLSCYLDSGPGRIILDRGRKALSRLHASEVASPASGKKEGDPETGSEEGRERFKAPGDPYRRQLIEQTRRGNSRLHMEPPAILWPKPLWTGKQVITCILKTLVDGMAASRFSQCRASGQGKGGLGSGGGDEEGEDALNRYEGVNLTGKAKTPGDAWGGAEDGDKEEEVVIIRNSELLQGVFDKAQFGPTAGGLVHCVFLLFGGAAAGLLLQSLAALFCAFLKLRSATTSPADFVMRREGELQRQALVRQVIQAGTYLQEHFTSRMNALMGWHDDGRDNPLLPTLSASCSHEPTGAECEGGLAKDEKTHVLSKDTALLKMAAASVAPKDEAKESEMSGDDAGQDELSAALEGALKVEKLNLARLSDAAAYALRLLGTGTACEDAAEPQSPSADTEAHKGKAARVKHEAGAYAEDSKDLAKHQGKDSLESPAATSALLPASSLNPWILSRYLKTPELLAASGTLPTRRRMCEELRRLIEILTHVQKTGSPSARKELLCFLACSPSLQQQLPHLAKVLGTDRLLPVQQRLRTTHPTQGSQDETPQAPFLHPPANHMVSLPNGAAIQGDAALLQKRLYHPSWLWEGGEEAGSKSAETESSDAAYSVAANIFEGTERYVLKGAKNAGIGGGEGGAQLRTFLMPSLLTVRRIGALYTSHFRGREDTFNEMLDAFFQSAMGKVASKSTDIMKGSYFLYRFPRNGFASMIKSGSKGSNVNFAMISVFLGQQSLEGQRVKFMTSDRSLPAFLPFDFGSRARGFITSSFLSGLKEEEYFFHCMAGREGLVDTAVKTAKSGYLQRSVTKGLEALTVRYDGSVRDADDSIVQFVYGDDGRDPAHRLTFEKIDMLLENPAILQRVHAPPSQLGSRPPERRLELAGGHGKNAEAKAQDEDIDTDSTADSDCLVQEYGSPLTRLGVTAFQFENDMQRLVDKAVARYETLRAAYSRTQDTSRQKKKRKATGHGVSEAVARDTRIGLEKDELEKILRVIYHKCCMPPGEAVGCVAAQSIGEPATQMTLNTFHLAGHGAANVTMGIPRLRELLQQGAVTKTPILYIPLRTAANPREDSPGADPEEREVDQGRVLVRNAGMALRSFTSIGLADCVHSVGVEANVCYQPPNCPKGCPAFHLPPYVSRSNSPNQLTAPSSRLYWQYEVCLQLENLSHFSQVVKSFAPAQICTLVLRKAHRLMVAAVAHHGRTDFAEVRSDLQAFFQNAICQDNKLTQWDHRSKVKEILRTARVGDSAAGEATDELFSAGASRAGNQEEREEGDNKRTETDADEKEADGSDRASSADEEEKEEKSDEEGEAENDELPDGRVSESEQSGAPSDDDQERSKTRSTKSEKRGVSSASGDAGVKAEQVTDEDESSGSGDEDATSSEDEDDPEDDGRSGKTGGKSLNADMLAKGEVSRGGRPRADAFESMFSPLLLSFARLVKGESFDMNTHLFFPQDKKQGSKTKRPIAVPAPVESDALWADGRKYKGFVLITREVASILHEVLVCPRTWRIILKFGWPFERCPYRLELLPLLMGLLKKCKMQEPEGVAAPRIVQGEGCVTKQKVEIQCEGSNFGWIHRMKDEAIDHNGILTNDVRAVLKYYGIEAARVCLARELERVFSAYGIKVDYRHLTLIADFMTHDGTLRPFNRLGMAASNAPFLQMSYETSFKFLTEACERAAVDSLSTPSGSLVVGTPSVIGSQQHQVFTQLHPALHRQRDLFKLSRKGNGVSQGDSTGNAKDEPEALVSRIKKKLVKSAHEDDKPSSRMNTDAPEIDRGEVAGGQEGTGVKREKSSHRHKERRDSALSNEAFNPGENGGDDEAKKKKKRKRKAFDFI